MTALLVGAAITFLVAAVFHWLNGRSLRREAERLRKLNVLTLRALEEGGIAKLNKDENGEPIGLHFVRFLNESAPASASISTHLIRGDEQIG